MATQNPMANQTWYTAKGKQVIDSAKVPISREDVDADLENFSGKVKRNLEAAEQNPDLKNISDFANEGVNEQLRQLRQARQAGVGAGRGEVNPNAEGKKKGGKVSATPKRSTGYRGYGIAKKV